MNALVDGECIQALYRASQAGVPVELNVRGICCLKPGVPGVSEHITVVSVVGRFLEHSRVYAFERGEETEVYVGSADLMPRNLDTRVELLAPVLDAELREQVVETIELCLADNVNAWVLDAGGTWQRRSPDGAPLSVQRQLMARHAARAAETATT
jgi:polyphosphate kinase